MSVTEVELELALEDDSPLLKIISEIEELCYETDELEESVDLSSNEEFLSSDEDFDFDQKISNDDNKTYESICKKIIKYIDNGEKVNEKLCDSFTQLAFSDFFAVHMPEITVSTINKLADAYPYAIHPALIHILLEDDKLFECIPHLIRSDKRNMDNITNCIIECDYHCAKRLFDMGCVNILDKRLYDMRSSFKNGLLAKAILNSDVEIPKDNLHTACTQLMDTKCIVEALLAKGHNFDSKCIDAVCKYSSIEALRYVIKHKILPTKSNFDKALCSGIDVLDKINLLIENNYSPDRNDIKKCLDRKIYIPDIERFDIVIDKPLIQAIQSTRTKRTYFTLCRMTPDAKDLYFKVLCSEYQSLHLEDFIERNGIILDKKHIMTILHNCSWYNSERLIEGYDLEITYDIVSEYTSHCSRFNQNIMKCLINRLNYHHITNVTKLQDKIKSLESQIKEQDKSDEAIKVINIPLHTKKVPKSKNRKCNMPKKYMEYFGISNKGKISYTDLRKKIIMHITDSNMICKDNKRLIDPSKRMRDLLGIEKEGMIKLEHLDRLINLFYK